MKIYFKNVKKSKMKKTSLKFSLKIKFNKINYIRVKLFN